MKYKSISIDGPSGAGKSSLARLLAQELRFLYVDTGALYRAVGLAVIRAGLNADEVAGIEELLHELRVEIRRKYGVQATYLNGEDVTDKIRSELISSYSSAISAIPAVRAHLLETQREAAKQNNVVMDGRDIGTVVLPDADIKIYLTASPHDRAMRRYEENLERGDKTPFETILESIIKRDEADSTRAVSPLRVPDGAVFVDTTGNTREQSLELLKGIIKERL